MHQILFSISIILLLAGCGGGGGGDTSSSSSSSVSSGSYTLGGSVNVGEQMVIDGDTKELLNPYIDNDGDSETQTQAVGNPATIGGFLGVTGYKTDIEDVYKVEMLAGQQLTLVVGDPAAHDFDLYLFDANGSTISNSMGTDQYEVLEIPYDGIFYIGVYGYSVVQAGDTGGLYNLMIGQGVPAATAAVLKKDRLSDRLPMVEGEVIFAQDATARSSGSDWKNDLNDSGIRVQSAVTSNGVTKARIAVSASASVRSGGVFTPQISDTMNAIKKLRRRSDIVYAEPNYILQPTAVPNDVYYPLQWHYPQISLPDAWDITTGSSDVVVAVIDTGVVLRHPDLSGQLVSGYDFISDPAISNDGDGIDSNPDDPGDGATNDDSSFHGTHVAGTVAAATNNGIGVAGVAWKSRVMPIRVLGQGGGTTYDISQGIYFAAGLSNDSGTVPAKKADIINMSLGGAGYSQTMQDAVNAAYNAGVIIVAAAGNDNVDATNYSPAGLSNVITVSAVDYSAAKAPYSNYGTVVEVAAPGGNTGADGNADGYADGVLSTVDADSYRFYQGTSMAAPHIAGVFALMKSVDSDLTQTDILRLLAGDHPETTQAITVDKGTAGKDIYYGYGLINALGAVKAAQALADQTVSPLPVLSAQPESFAFNNAVLSGTLSLVNAGSGTLQISSVTPTQSWLSVTATGTPGAYSVVVTPDGLDNGVYNAAIDIVSNGGNVSVPVLLTLSDSTASGGDVGIVYVLLVDAETYVTKAEYAASSGNGYAFSLSGVAAGSYYLVAGTDIDGDYYTNNTGEAYGIYPTFSQPQPIAVSDNVQNLNLTVSYQTALQTLGAAMQSEMKTPQRVPLMRGGVQ